MKQVRLALMGNYAMQFMARGIRKAATKRGMDLALHTTEYNTIDLDIINPASPLYDFAPDFILWHESTLALRDQFYAHAPEDRESFGQRYADRVRGHLATLAAAMPECRIIFPDHSLIMEDYVFGHFGNKLPSAWQYQVVKLNHLLYELASETDNLLILGGNPSSVSDILDHPLAVTADLHFSLPYIDWLGRQALGMIESRYGKMKKCLILDLDNTLWGGIIGDDGMEGIQIGSLGIGKAFTRFQKWLRELGQRGIILAVCSKNNEDIAREPFLRHPEMILRLDDISVFVANWESKSDNISRIRDILNIGLDSMVFIDDNPAEREIVRRHLPEVTVPELPEDPALYLPYLTSLNLFETATFSKDDRQRTRQYQEESKRRLLAASITNMDEFLDSLDMRGRIGPFSEVDVERISQLSLRSNQFNLRTIRYNTAEIREIMQDPACETFSVELSDKFGHYGLISIVIIRIREDDRAEIDTWIMSCRVLKRTVEHFLMNHIAERLRHRGVQLLTGEYLPTEKNGLVRELLPTLGFNPIEENTYRCDLTSYPALNTNIQRNDHQHQ